MAGGGNPAQPQDTPQVEVVANPNLAGNAAFAGRNNAALELAGSLRELSPTMTQLGVEYEAQAKERATEDARKAALTNKGLGFAEAVRQGKIDPTASPFWMAAYKNEAAKVATTNFANQLRVEQASWQEQSDPSAFQAKTQQAFADFGKQFTDPNENEGFNAVAQQQQQNILAANTEKNVQEITATRMQNLSALASQAIMDATRKAGGKPTGAQLAAALDPIKQQWLATGGRLPDWNQHAVIPAIQAAAFETWNPSVLDAAKTLSNGGKGTIYDEAGAAEGFETIRHRIDQDNRMKLSQDMEIMALRKQQDMLAAQSDMFKMLGPSLFTGTVTQDQVQSATAALAGKHNPAAVVAALKDAAEIGTSYREIGANRYATYEQSAAGAAHIIALHNEATTQGWSPEFEDELGQMALQGNVSPTTVDQLSDQARKRSLDLAKAQAGPTAPGSRVFNAQAANVNAWKSTRSAITGSIADTAKALASRNGISLSQADQQALQDFAINAASDHLQTTPEGGHGRSATKDFPGAVATAKAAAHAWLTQYIQRNHLGGR